MSNAQSAIVITGAARGQGAAHARHMAQKGYSVFVTDVLDTDGVQLTQQLTSDGLNARYRHLDVTQGEEWSALGSEIQAQGLQLKGVVNNAGILRYHSIADTPLETWILHEHINVHGPFLGIQQLADQLKINRGAVVNVSSTAALRGTAGYAAYSASKASLLALTRVAAAELAPEVRVNAICPGGVSTPMNNDEPTGGSSSGAPMGRRARPEEISPLIEYLLTDSSSFVTGSAFTIDGGLTAV